MALLLFLLMYNILSWEVVDVDAATQSMKVGASFALDMLQGFVDLHTRSRRCRLLLGNAIEFATVQ